MRTFTRWGTIEEKCRHRRIVHWLFAPLQWMKIKFFQDKLGWPRGTIDINRPGSWGWRAAEIPLIMIYTCQGTSQLLTSPYLNHLAAAQLFCSTGIWPIHQLQAFLVDPTVGWSSQQLSFKQGRSLIELQLWYQDKFSDRLMKACEPGHSDIIWLSAPCISDGRLRTSSQSLV